MEYWKGGMLGVELKVAGRMEYWKGGILGVELPETPSFHQSIISISNRPLFHHSIIPLFQFISIVILNLISKYPN
jgi:hypothetical protein